MSTLACYSCDSDEAAAVAARECGMSDPSEMDAPAEAQREAAPPPEAPPEAPQDAPAAVTPEADTLPAACFAPPTSQDDSTNTGPLGWPWARIARPAVVQVATGGGVIDAGPVAAIDYAVVAARDAIASAVGLPVSLSMVASDDPTRATHAYGVVLAGSDVEALITFDPQSVRLLASALAVSAGAAPSPAAPGPIAEAGEVDKGLIEYLTLVVLDRVLRAAGPRTKPPTITAFCDPGAAGVWLQRHVHRCFSLALAVGASTGIVRLHLAGLGDDHAAALRGCLSMLDWSGAPPATVNVALALPAIALQPEERAAMQAGDVLLLGAASLMQMPAACELVTDTQWSIGRATITHDTPTYLNASFTPGHPAPRAAALAAGEQNLIQPMIGASTLPIDRLARWTAGDALPLAKNAAAPVTLFQGVMPIGRGELIVLGSELGVRLLDVNANP